MAFLYNTGPVYCWAGIYSPVNSGSGASLGGGPGGGPGPLNAANSLSNTILFLGTAERYPVVVGQRHYNPVYNDIGGPLVPFDKEFQGETKILSIELNRFNQSVLDLLSAGLGGGVESRLARGSLLLHNRLSFALWLRFGFFGTPNQIAADLPIGEVYPACNLLEVTYDPMGTVTRKTNITVEANPAWLAADGSFLTYTNSPTFFTGIPAFPGTL